MTGSLVDLFTRACTRLDLEGRMAAALARMPPLAGRCHVMALGKSAPAMVQAALPALAPFRLGACLIATRAGALQALGWQPPEGWEVIISGHPEPDAGSLEAGERALSLANSAGKDDVVLVLLSGGASALVEAPVAGVSLDRLAALNARLLASGVDIHAINTVRRHLSRIKGGNLARAAAPARIVTLAMSDVVGDDPAVIGSGPTMPAPAAPEAARALLSRLGEDPDAWPLHALPGEEEEIGPRPFALVLSNDDLRRALAAEAGAEGLTPVDLGGAWVGEAAEIGRALAERALAAPDSTLLIAGGEVTVDLGSGPAGRGGPNQEAALACARALAASGAGAGPGVTVQGLFLDTDGIDGSGGAAGACFDSKTISRGAERGLDVDNALSRHDSGTFLEAVGGRYAPGPLPFNLNDIYLLRIGGGGGASPSAA